MAEDSWSALLLVMVYLASVTLVKAGPGATSHGDVRDVMGVPQKPSKSLDSLDLNIYLINTYPIGSMVLLYIYIC